MSANEIHYNDIGTVFEVIIKDDTVTQDVSLATVKQLIFRGPDGTTLTKTAVFKTDGTDGIIQYTTIDGDLSQVGRWEMQAFLELPSGEWHSDIQAFTVYDNL